MVTAQVFGDVQAKDDYTAGAGEELQREHVLQLLRHGTQPRRISAHRQSRERGYAEVTLCLYEPDGGALQLQAPRDR